MERAWYYQERILSTRVVSFGETELYWECRARQCCECGHPWPQLLSAEVSNLDVPRYLTETTYARSSDIHKWHQLVKRYTRLNLTFESDVLPALQGIATMWQREVTGAYLAGLWKEYLMEGLLWRSQLFGSRPSKYRAPTWSWASIQGWAEWWSEDISEKDKVASVLDVSTTPAGLDPRGEIVAGKLMLKGRRIPATMGYEGSHEHFRPANRVKLNNVAGGVFGTTQVGPGEWFPDISTNVDKEVDILLIEMVEVHDATPTAIYFLGLKKVHNNGTVYERVGCARTDQSDVRLAFQEFGEEMVITIV